jgi:hypothetical protein
MSDVQSRPAARGRSSARGGRGATYGSRGPRANNQTNGGLAPNDTSADDGELAELKRRYASELTILKDMFVDWTDEDLIVAIEESDGDIQATVEKITEGKHPASPHQAATHLPQLAHVYAIAAIDAPANFFLLQVMSPSSPKSRRARTVPAPR